MDKDKEFRDWIDEKYPSLSPLTNEEIAESVIFPVELTDEEKKESEEFFRNRLLKFNKP